MNKQIREEIDGQMDGWIDGWTNIWMDKCLDRWINEWMDGWMDRWFGWVKWVNYLCSLRANSNVLPASIISSVAISLADGPQLCHSHHSTLSAWKGKNDELRVENEKIKRLHLLASIPWWAKCATTTAAHCLHDIASLILQSPIFFWL